MVVGGEKKSNRSACGARDLDAAACFFECLLSSHHYLPLPPPPPRSRSRSDYGCARWRTLRVVVWS